MASSNLLFFNPNEFVHTSLSRINAPGHLCTWVEEMHSEKNTCIHQPTHFHTLTNAQAPKNTKTHTNKHTYTLTQTAAGVCPSLSGCLSVSVLVNAKL